MNYLQILQLAAPETIVTLTVLAVLGVDLTALRGKSVPARFHVGALISILSGIIFFTLGLIAEQLSMIRKKDFND